MAESYDRQWQLATLRESVEIWNRWREEQPEVVIDLEGADLRGAYLQGANLKEADLGQADLRKAWLIEADLRQANLIKADLSGAYLQGAYLFRADLRQADLQKTDLRQANLTGAWLIEAKLNQADLAGANLAEANLTAAQLSGANLTAVDLRAADLRGADLNGADLTMAICVATNFSGATLTDCRVYGISSWDTNLDATTQRDLCITSEGQAIVTVDNLKVAQFISLMLNDAEIRNVIDTITTKVVLILGRFTPERKVVLGALRDELRKHNYLPVIFEFKKPSDQRNTEMVILLARIARFIVADLTLPSSIPQELDAIFPTVTVPVQPVIELGHEPWTTYTDNWPYDWVLPVHRYTSLDELLASIESTIIGPAETKVEKLRSTISQVTPHT